MKCLCFLIFFIQNCVKFETELLKHMDMWTHVRAKLSGIFEKSYFGMQNLQNRHFFLKYFLHNLTMFPQINQCFISILVYNHEHVDACPRKTFQNIRKILTFECGTCNTDTFLYFMYNLTMCPQINQCFISILVYNLEQNLINLKSLLEGLI